LHISLELKFRLLIFQANLITQMMKFLGFSTNEPAIIN